MFSDREILEIFHLSQNMHVSYTHYYCVAKYLCMYRGSPTNKKITNTVSTTTVFGLCMCKWGIFALVPLTQIYQISSSTVFSNTANVYRQMTDKLMFISVISTVRWIRKLDIVKCKIYWYLNWSLCLIYRMYSVKWRVT